MTRSTSVVAPGEWTLRGPDHLGLQPCAESLRLTGILVLEQTQEDEVEEFTIVGARESDPMNNKISNESPLGAALLGKKKGQVVKVNTPGGIRELKIIDIHL